MKKILILFLFLTFNVGYARDFSQAELSIVNITKPEINGFSDRYGFLLFGLIGSLVEHEATKEKHTEQINKNLDGDRLIQLFLKGLEIELRAVNKFKSINIIPNTNEKIPFRGWHKNETLISSYDKPNTSDYICEFGIEDFTLHKQFLGDVITASAVIKIFDKKKNMIIATSRDFSVQYPPSIKDDAPVEETQKIIDEVTNKVVKIITKGVVEKIDFDKINE